MSKTLALVGNPNSGKTTLFNNLTGSKQYVGNWPGVTVERKGGKLKKHDGFEVMDLPGIYSLSPYSPEEVITRNYLLEENPDVIVNIVDGSNLERNLYLTCQLIDMDVRMVIALNMMDEVTENGGSVDVNALESFLGTVEEIDLDRSKVRVVVSMFGRETPVELELDQVEPVKA